MLAGGTTLGVVAFTAVPVLAAARTGVRWRPRLARDPEVGRLARQGAWAGVYLGLTQLLTLGVLVLGNGVDGTVARFTFALGLLPAPVRPHRGPRRHRSLPGHGQRRAGPPPDRLARLVGRRRWSRRCPGSRLGQRRPAGPGLAAGAPDRRSVRRPTAHWVLSPTRSAAFAPGLIGYGLFYLLTRVRYAQGDVRSPTLANGSGRPLRPGDDGAGIGLTVDGERAAALAAAYGGAHLVGAVVLGVITDRSLPTCGAAGWSRRAGGGAARRGRVPRDGRGGSMRWAPTAGRDRSPTLVRRRPGGSGRVRRRPAAGQRSIVADPARGSRWLRPSRTAATGAPAPRARRRAGSAATSVHWPRARGSGWEVVSPGPPGCIDGIRPVDVTSPIPSRRASRRGWPSARGRLRRGRRASTSCTPTGSRPDGWRWPAVASDAGRPPVVVTVHNLVLDETSGRAARFMRVLERRVLKRRRRPRGGVARGRWLRRAAHLPCRSG